MYRYLVLSFCLVFSTSIFALNPGDRVKVGYTVKGAIGVDGGRADLVPSNEFEYIGRVNSRFFSAGALRLKVVSGPNAGRTFDVSTITSLDVVTPAAQRAPQAPQESQAPKAAYTPPANHGGHAAQHQGAVGMVAPAKGEFLRYRNYEDNQAAFRNIQNKFRARLEAKGLKFPLLNAGKAEREKVFQVLKTFSWKEQAMISMIGTSWAESREKKYAGDARDPQDPQAKANKVYTMHTLKMRAEDTDNDYLIEARYREHGTLARVTGAVAKKYTFSSWNAGSPNFANMLNALTGPYKTASGASVNELGLFDKVALESTVNAYHDYVRGMTQQNGFSGPNGERAHHMLNRHEMKDPASKVSWSLERKMRDFKARVNAERAKGPANFERFKKSDYFRYGHNVAVRVKDFSIVVPDENRKMHKVSAAGMNHWPAYTTMMDAGGESMSNFNAAKRGQGAW